MNWLNYPKDPVKFVEHIMPFIDASNDVTFVRDVIYRLTKKEAYLLISLMNNLSSEKLTLFLNEIPFGVTDPVLKTCIRINEARTGKPNPEYSKTNQTIIVVEDFPIVDEGKIIEFLGYDSNIVKLRRFKDKISARISIRSRDGYLVEDPDKIVEKFEGKDFQGYKLKADTFVLLSGSTKLLKRHFYDGLVFRGLPNSRALFNQIRHKQHCYLCIVGDEIRVAFKKKENKKMFLVDKADYLKDVKMTEMELDQCLHPKEIIQPENDPSKSTPKKQESEKKVPKKSKKNSSKKHDKPQNKDCLETKEIKPSGKHDANIEINKTLRISVETKSYSIKDIKESAEGYAGKSCKVSVSKSEEDYHYIVEFEKAKKGMLFYQELKDGHYFDCIELLGK